MIELLLKAVKVVPVLFAASLFAGSSVTAQTITADKEGVNQTLEQINNYQQLDQNNQSQVTNVNQLRDVSPTDWAYEALRSLVDRYGCISGFPNQTYRGSQPLTRYEFAAGLNSCLNQIERLIASTGGDGVDGEQLETIERLTQEFEAELATLGGRVDEIESRTAVLEDSQFSTTTKLKGEGIFAISDAFGGGLDFDDSVEDIDGDGDISDEEVEQAVLDGAGDTNGDGEIDDDELDEFRDNAEDDSEIDSETAFSSRVRLNFDTSFFGQDRLRTRLEGGNVTRYDGDLTNTNSARLGFDTNSAVEGSDFNVEVSDLHYRFPATEKVTAWVGARGLDLDDIFAVTNPMLEGSGDGALSRFSRRNPLIFRGVEGAGAGLNLDIIEDKVGVNIGYLTTDGEDGAADPSEREGLFNGSFNAGAQIEVSPIEALKLSATYVRDYQTGNEDGFAGGTVGAIDANGDITEGFAANPFGDLDTTANKIGLGANLNVGEKIVLAGFGGYADVEGLADGENPDGQVWTWGANASVLDLVKEGSVLSIAGGMLPKFISDIEAAEFQNDVEEDPDTSYLVEALYKFPLNDNIEITPGAYAIFNPNHVTENDTVYVGVVRTTFKF